MPSQKHKHVQKLQRTSKMSSANDALNEHFLFLFLITNSVQHFAHLWLLCCPSLVVRLLKLLQLKKTKQIHANLSESAPEFNVAHRQKQWPSPILAPNTTEFKQINMSQELKCHVFNT